MCVYHSQPYTFADHEEELIWVRHWSLDMELQARSTLINIEALLVAFVGLVCLAVLYGVGIA